MDLVASLSGWHRLDDIAMQARLALADMKLHCLKCEDPRLAYATRSARVYLRSGSHIRPLSLRWKVHYMLGIGADVTSYAILPQKMAF